MSTLKVEAAPLGPTPCAPSAMDCERWEQSCAQLLAAVPESCRPAAERLLRSLHVGGGGLREWVSAIAWRGAVCPETVPASLIEIYLNDPEAEPLHDCESCGLAVPVRPNRLHGHEAEPDYVYFPTCPCCGGRTGWYMYWSSRAEQDPILPAIRRRAPR